MDLRSSLTGQEMCLLKGYMICKFVFPLCICVLSSLAHCGVHTLSTLIVLQAVQWVAITEDGQLDERFTFTG
jgi:hypothetical protein